MPVLLVWIICCAVTRGCACVGGCADGSLNRREAQRQRESGLLVMGDKATVVFVNRMEEQEGKGGGREG